MDVSSRHTGYTRFQSPVIPFHSPVRFCHFSEWKLYFGNRRSSPLVAAALFPVLISLPVGSGKLEIISDCLFKAFPFILVLFHLCSSRYTDDAELRGQHQHHGPAEGPPESGQNVGGRGAHVCRVLLPGAHAERG